ncbi:hypothetical protein F2Q68_00022673 [Brassica cretica]|uniref:Uncharacterized protein n=1 Tax=Brassica cretica TaxID=69181 RepID=A0A8S9G542_BRACR|nr:hypothetical protein F2Q68_00022673 [Brassica cretica]
MAFFSETKPNLSFGHSSSTPLLSLSCSLSLSRVESTESSGVLSSTESIGVIVGVLVVSHPLLDEIKRNQLLIYRRLRVSASHLDDTSSLSLSSTRTLLSPSSRRYLAASCSDLMFDLFCRFDSVSRWLSTTATELSAVALLGSKGKVSDSCFRTNDV